VFSDNEQKILDDIERIRAVEGDKAAGAVMQRSRQRTRDSRALDEMTVGGFCIAIMLVFVGAPVAGLTVGGVTAVGWLLWQSWPHSRGGNAASASQVIGKVHPYVGRRTRHRRSLGINSRAVASARSKAATQCRRP
jgi:hypothetical protein